MPIAIIGSNLSFPVAIPHRWAVKEMFRTFNRLSSDDDKYNSMSVIERISYGIVELLNTNRIVPMRDVYGLTATALCAENLLKGATSIACSLRARTNQSKSMVVIADNHRHFVVNDIIVDPMFDYLSEKGSDPIRSDCHVVQTYPDSIARAVLSFIDDKSNIKSPMVIDDNISSWFIQTVRLLARKAVLNDSAWWNDKDKRDVRARKDFEGMMRGMVPAFQNKSKDMWESILLNSIMMLWPRMGLSSAVNFVKRIQDEFGPALPRSLGKPRKRAIPVDPESTLNSSGTNPIIQPDHNPHINYI